MSKKLPTSQNPQVTNKTIYGEDSVSMKDFALGTIVGAVIGASLALLYAPKAGSDLRQDVATQATTLKSKGLELSNVAKDKTVQLSKDLKEQSTQLVEKVKVKTSKEADSILEEVEDEFSIEDVVDAVEESAEELAGSNTPKPDASIEEILEESKA